MWIFGQASKAEIKKIKKQGWEVNDVDLDHFDLCLDPNSEADKDIETKDKMIAVFVDNDIFSQLTNWHEEEKVIGESKRKAELDDLRSVIADNLWLQSDALGSVSVTDSEGWETDGDIWIRKFYYENPELDKLNSDSSTATFIVTFKANSDKAVGKGDVNW
jgi:hypothetical protein